MNQLIINRHNFDNAKQELQKFSEQDLRDLSLEKVDEGKSLGEFLFGGGWGLDHRVTGEELNKLITQLQEILILLRDRQNSTIKAFSMIVTALNSLDKDYLDNIFTALTGLGKLGDDIQKEQKNLEEVVNTQQLTYEVLLRYKEKLSQYEHLDDVDDMWVKLQESAQAIDAAQDILKDIYSLLSRHTKQLDNLKGDHSRLQKIQEELDKTNSQLQELTRLQAEVNDQKNTIQSLQTLLVSLQEVPSRVQKIQANLDETSSQLQELARLREEVADQKCTILTLQAALDAEKQNASNWYQGLRKKNQMTVILAGSAIFLAAAEFLLLVVGVL